MTIRRLLIGAVLGVVASCVVVAPAVAAPVYPPAVEALTVSASIASAGSTITVSGDGFEPGSTVTVTVTVGGVVVRTLSVTADSNGEISLDLLLSSVGTNVITVTGVDPDGATRVLVSSVTITAAGSGSGSGAGSGLPNTGANISTQLILGGVLVLGGAGAVLAARRRRRSGTASTS